MAAFEALESCVKLSTRAAERISGNQVPNFISKHIFYKVWTQIETFISVESEPQKLTPFLLLLPVTQYAIAASVLTQKGPSTRGCVGSIA